MGRSPGLWLYLALTERAEGFAAQRLSLRVRRGHEPSDRSEERLGHANQARPKGPVVWFHAASLQRARQVQELIRRMGLEREDATFLVTTSSGAPLDESALQLAPNSVHQYAPYEAGAAIRRFLDHWMPDVAFWVGSELWPALITQTANAGIPLHLIDARMSAETHYRWRWVPGIAASILRRFDLILAAEKRTEVYLRRLGMDPARIEVVGGLDEGTVALPCNEAEREWLAEQLAARPVWLAAHVTRAEEEAVVAAHSRAARHAHRLLLILVPDDPARGPALRDELRDQRWVVGLRSDGDEPESETQIYVADSSEEMGLWYRVAPITFLGRSLMNGGGANPFEPAALGSAVVHGPSVGKFASEYQRLVAASATRQVKNAESLGIAVEDLLMPDRTAEMAHAAWEVTSRGADVTDRIIGIMQDALENKAER